MRNTFRKKSPIRNPKIPHLIPLHRNPARKQYKDIGELVIPVYHFSIDGQFSKNAQNYTRPVVPNLLDVSDFHHNANRDHGQEIDKFIALAQEFSLSQSITQFFCEILPNSSCYYWEDIPSQKLLFCSAENMTCEREVGFPGLAYVTRKPIYIPNPQLSPNFSILVDEKIVSKNSFVICFPIFDFRDSICGVIEIARIDNFPESFEPFIKSFTTKFKLLSKWILNLNEKDDHIAELMQLLTKDQWFQLCKKKTYIHF